MDEGELQEGLTLKELFQVLKDKGNVEGGSEVNRHALCALRLSIRLRLRKKQSRG